MSAAMRYLIVGIFAATVAWVLKPELWVVLAAFWLGSLFGLLMGLGHEVIQSFFAPTPEPTDPSLLTPEQHKLWDPKS